MVAPLHQRWFISGCATRLDLFPLYSYSTFFIFDFESDENYLSLLFGIVVGGGGVGDNDGLWELLVAAVVGAVLLELAVRGPLLGLRVAAGQLRGVNVRRKRVLLLGRQVSRLVLLVGPRRGHTVAPAVPHRRASAKRLCWESEREKHQRASERVRDNLPELSPIF